MGSEMCIRDSRKAVKSQILTDFIAEWTDTQIQAECRLMYYDGSVMKTGAGAGLLFVSPLGGHMRYVVRLHFPASNNMAEYEALLSGLRITIELGVKCLDVRGDSQLVIDQVMMESSCHDAKMEAFCNAVRYLEDKFDRIELNHITRKYNEEAGELAKIASGRTTIPLNVFAHDFAKPSVDFKSRAEATGAAPDPRGLQPPSPWLKTPRWRSSRPWTQKPRSPWRTRLQRWRLTRPRLRETGVPSILTR